MASLYKNYDLGPNVDIEDITGQNTLTIFDIIDLTFKTDGVDDKIYHNHIKRNWRNDLLWS